MKKIAIIGAGLSGLTLAQTLNGYADVTIFEKSRGVGGRMSTRYANPFQFDHGAQFFTVRSEKFLEFLTPYIDRNLIGLWHRKHVTNLGAAEVTHMESCYVAAPKMTELARELSTKLNIKTQTEITRIKLFLDDDKVYM